MGCVTGVSMYASDRHRPRGRRPRRTHRWSGARDPVGGVGRRGRRLHRSARTVAAAGDPGRDAAGALPRPTPRRRGWGPIDPRQLPLPRPRRTGHVGATGRPELPALVRAENGRLRVDPRAPTVPSRGSSLSAVRRSSRSPPDDARHNVAGASTRIPMHALVPGFAHSPAHPDCCQGLSPRSR